MYFHLVHFLDIAVQKKFYRETKGLCCCDRRVKLELNKVSPELYDLFTCNSNEVVAFKMLFIVTTIILHALHLVLNIKKNYVEIIKVYILSEFNGKYIIS